MKIYIISSLIIISLIGFINGQGSEQGDSISQHTILVDDTNQIFKVVDGIIENGVAWALFDGNPNVTGWMYLSINTSSSFEDSVQARAAGYLEGYLSYQAIYDSLINTYVNRFNNPNNISADVYQWITNNIGFMNKQIQLLSGSSNYWYQVGLVYDQIDSMADGYNAAVDGTDMRTISIVDLFLLNMGGDILDLIPALMYQNGHPPPPTPITKIADLFINSHCSSLIKLTDDLTELYAGHTTWDNYTSMLRTFKSYSFAYSGVAGGKVLFSSYPGSLTSIDDFYMLDSGMVVMETTNDVLNQTLYANVTYNSLLSWVRVLVANRMSTSGLQWCETVSQYNSGTYNNQWIILDYKRFVPGHKLLDGALYILEQLPGYIEYDDQTAMLRNGFWPSYNVPFYETVYNMSGFNSFVVPWNVSNGIDYLSYIANPRSQIFRRDANSVASIQDFQRILRYNDYQNDPLSHDDPTNAIASRFELLPESNPNRMPLGATDSKMTSFSLFQQNIAIAISGPTYDTVPPFQFSTVSFNPPLVHQGMPDLYYFGWYQFTNTSFIPF